MKICTLTGKIPPSMLLRMGRSAGASLYYIGEQEIDTLTINTMIPEQTFIFNFPKLSKYK